MMSESERTRSAELRPAPSAKYRNSNASRTKMKNPLLRVKMSESTNQALQVVYLARHGETAWTLSGQHTGLTDLALTERGERNARRLEERLRGLSFAKVFTSPLQRARRTCELAGFGAVAETDPDLLEWSRRFATSSSSTRNSFASTATISSRLATGNGEDTPRRPEAPVPWKLTTSRTNRGNSN